jgi:cytochrome c oxidase subunit I
VSETYHEAARVDLVRRLTLRYVYASTLIFFASGAMGVVLRFTQADVPGRLGDNFWYALMTAHGLGAFVGWAAFAVMGFAWWVLASVGLAARGFGYAMALLTWWLMVLGVLGVIVTTLLMSFAASWVFLYPLPFYGSGEWTDLAAGLFSASVLLAGLSIVTWCLGILHTVVGPGLHAVSGRLANRLGVALGMGYLFPRTFATNPRSVPYPVIPLTVIGIDMIIATLPLAGLLVWMIFESIWPGMDVDPLLAKNILWFFGHPVVYLLLFPAVAMFYYLVPRYAGRPLVAGNVVAVAWLVAVTANVMIWAHHVYLDYPEDTFQGWLNTLHQPLTFAIVLPSALSLYSLSFTIFRSDWRWGAAQTALFLALLSWFLAGLQGIVNATIAFQETIHNTLWIVGHFHHMAFANIGLVIVAGIYAFLPELTGKRLYSESLAKLHVWATFVGVTGNSVLWLWQGLEGGPRRFSVLPDAYSGTLTYLALPFVALIAVAQVPFAYNIVQTLRGVEPKESRRTWADSTAEAVYVLAALFLVTLAAAAGFLVGRETAPAGGVPAATTGEADPGPAVYADAGCGSCHAFEPAGSSGTIGPSLDETQLDAAAVADVVANGRGAMPAFEGRLSDEEIEAVSAYVARAP